MSERTSENVLRAVRKAVLLPAAPLSLTYEYPNMYEFYMECSASISHLRSSRLPSLPQSSCQSLECFIDTTSMITGSDTELWLAIFGRLALPQSTAEVVFDGLDGVFTVESF